MKTMTAAKDKNAFGQMIEAAQREPVLIIKQNRLVGIFISIREIEDYMLGGEALKHMAESLIGAEASRMLIEKLFNAKDSPNHSDVGLTVFVFESLFSERNEDNL